MRAFDEDALICDFAQYYSIYDFNSLPLLTQAVLACGLPLESRIKKKAAGAKFDFDTLLLAGILDAARVQNYKGTKDAKNHINKPESILEKLLGHDEEPEEEIVSFKSGKDFDAYRQKLIGTGG